MSIQDPLGCNAALVKQTLHRGVSRRVGFASLLSITKESWEKLRSEMGADVEIFGVPLGFSYEDFKDRCSRYVQNEQLNFSIDEAEYVLWSGINSTQINGWLECKRLTARMNHGLWMWAESFDEESANVVFILHLPPGVDYNKVEVDDSVVIGGTVVQGNVDPGRIFPKGFEFEDRGEVRMDFRRHPGESLKITVQAGAFAGSLALPKPPPPAQPFEQVLYNEGDLFMLPLRRHGDIHPQDAVVTETASLRFEVARQGTGFAVKVYGSVHYDRDRWNYQRFAAWNESEPLKVFPFPDAETLELDPPLPSAAMSYVRARVTDNNFPFHTIPGGNSNLVREWRDDIPTENGNHIAVLNAVKVRGTRRQA